MSTEPAPSAPRPALQGVASRPGVAKPDPILVVDSLEKSFGGLRAVDVEHLEVERRSITALIGPNGAGKTTLFNLLSGFEGPDSGSWQYDGEDVTGFSAHRIARRGLVRTFQLTRVLAKLTVGENMMLAAADQSGERFFPALARPLWWGQERENEERADRLLDRFGLAHMRDEYAGELSGGQRKLLEMARSLMTEPKLLMLDEPVAGVNPALRERILEHLNTLREEGMTLVFIEHDMDVVLGVSDWVVCLALGQVISEGQPERVATDEAVIDAYLGTRRGPPPVEET